VLRLIAVFLLLSTFCAHGSQSGTLHIEGKAFDLDSDQLVYTEEHVLNGDGNHEVIYKEPSGEIFAQKSLSYNNNPQAPDVEQVNSRIGEVIEVKSIDNNRLSASYAREDKQVSKSNTMAIPDGLVIDAGFNRFIQAHWDALRAGEKIAFEWFVPSRLKPVELVVEAKECETPNSNACFVINPKNWFISLVLQPIRLSYDPEQKRLQQYEGRSNIAAKDGDYHKVRIEYSYSVR